MLAVLPRLVPAGSDRRSDVAGRMQQIRAAVTEARIYADAFMMSRDIGVCVDGANQHRFDGGDICVLCEEPRQTSAQIQRASRRQRRALAGLRAVG